ncbi:MAG: lysophospholipid acyltransferase family protein [Verrucomicrobia bacterium]|nr:lysophospholipid acyltransferase family protein [Verrucomicrobiota bacterium]
MIAARKNSVFNFVIRRALARALRRRFHAVQIAGVEHLRALVPDRPVIGCANHTNWWDGFLLYVLSHRLLPAHDIFLAMEEANLRRYPFFRWMGCFGVDLDAQRSSAALPGVRYAVRLLRGSADRLVWLFVQGRLASPRVAVEAKTGALWLARHTGAQLLPLSIRYEWLAESRPTIFVRIGAPFFPGVDDSAAVLAEKLNALLAATDDALLRSPPELRDYAPLFPPQLSFNKRWDLFLHRLRGGRARNFERANRL